MAKTPVWDAAFLKERERDAKEQAEQAQFEADWEQADAQFGREFSDANNGFKLCPLRACLRARRCTSDELLCLDLLPVRFSRATANRISATSNARSCGSCSRSALPSVYGPLPGVSSFPSSRAGRGRAQPPCWWGEVKKQLKRKRHAEDHCGL